MTMKERKEKAEQELKRVNAIMKVYELIENVYHTEFCEMSTNDDGSFITDDEGNYVYKEVMNLVSFKYDYDDKAYNEALHIMKEVLDKVANMK